MLGNSWAILVRGNIHQIERVNYLWSLSHLGLFLIGSANEVKYVLIWFWGLYFWFGLLYFLGRVGSIKGLKDRLELLILWLGLKFNLCLFGLIYLFLDRPWFLLDHIRCKFGHDEKLRFSIPLQILISPISLKVRNYIQSLSRHLWPMQAIISSRSDFHR